MNSEAPLRLACLGITRSYLDRWLEIARRLDIVLVLIDSEDSLKCLRLPPSEPVELITLERQDLGHTLLQLRRENLRKKFDGILTPKDQYLGITSQLALEWGLPGNPPEVVKLFSNKNGMRELAKKAGLKTARSYSNPNSIEQYPVIVKPNDRSGSHLVSQAANFEQTMKAIANITAQSPQSQVVIEEQIPGSEVSIEALVVNGVGRVMGVTEKFLFSESFVEQAHISPCSETLTFSPQDIIDRIMKVVPELSFAALHIEGFLTPEFTIGEIHLRWGGDHIVTLTERAHDVDLIEPIFRASLGLAADLPQPKWVGQFHGVGYSHASRNVSLSSSNDRGEARLFSAPERESVLKKVREMESKYESSIQENSLAIL